MPPLDSLGPESDYSGFMSPGVSDELRRLALRKLFHSPLYNITDGLDDYDDDFRSFAVLSEAFHAKKTGSSATESAEAAGTERKAAGEAGRSRPASPPEHVQEAEADAALHSDGEDAEVAARRPLPDPDVRTSGPSPGVSDEAHLPAEGGEAGAEASPDDADAPAAPLGFALRRSSSSGSSGEHEEGDGAPRSSADPRAEEKAPAKDPDDREGTEGLAAPGRGAGGQV